MFIGCAHQRRRDDKVCSRSRIGDGNIVNLGNTKQCLHIGIVGLSGQRIRKEDNQVDSSFYNLCADLLITASRTAVVALYGQVCLIRDHTRGGAGSAQRVLA